LAHATGFDIGRLLKWQAVARQSVSDAEVDANIEIVLARGKLAALHTLGGTMAQANGNKPPDAHIDNAMEELVKLQTLGSTRNQSPQERVHILRDRLTQSRTTAIMTELGRLDLWTWGFRSKAVTVMASAYKQRKTTTIRNIALAAAARGIPVSIATCEDGKTEFDACFTAMIANQILLGGYVSGSSFSDDERKLSGDYILEGMAWRNSRGQNAAVERALDIYEQLPIYIYDVADDNADDPWQMRARFRRDNLTKGVKLCFVDYAQLMTWPGDTLQRQMEAAANWVRKTAGTLDIHIVMAAQLNEIGVSGGGGYSPSVKGGGDLPAAAHSVLTTNYDSQETPGLLSIKLKLARGARQGQVERFIIEASSGLITGIERTNQQIEVVPSDLLAGHQVAFDDDLDQFIMGRDHN